MAIDYRGLLSLRIPETEHTYAVRDTLLYALALGMGSDPQEPRELAFALEEGLRVVPTLATVVSWDDAWRASIGIDNLKLVLVAQRLTLHRDLPAAASVLSRTRIVDVVDKGPKGALLFTERLVRLRDTGEPLCTVFSVSCARADGGFGGPSCCVPPPKSVPGRPPDRVCVLPTQPNQALLYRLCGDRNALHTSPEAAAAAGYPKPILHGLCTLGFACRALLRACLDCDPAGLVDFSARFTAPVFPGETLRTELWDEGEGFAFRTRVVERDAVVLDDGRAGLSKPRRGSRRLQPLRDFGT